MDEKYRRQIEKFQTLLESAKKKSDLLGNVKLLIFLILIFLIWAVFRYGFTWIACAVAALVFIILYVYHIRLLSRIDEYKALIVINQSYTERVQGGWINFADTGQEFVYKSHPYACDLDVIGDKSLFQLMNTSNTWHGRVRFSRDLLQADYSAIEILKRQEAIKELAQDIEYLNIFQYKAKGIKADKKIDDLLAALKKQPKMINSKILRAVLKYAPMFSAPFVFGAFVFDIRYAKIAAVHILLIQLFVWLFGLVRLNRIFQPMGELSYHLDSYAALFKMAELREFKAEKNCEIKNCLFGGDTSAYKAIGELGSIMQRINLRYNGLLYFVLNLFILWDYECIFMLEDWKEKYSSYAEQWFESIGELESMMCFSNLLNITEGLSFPEISENTSFEASQVGHPLISHASRVCNDFSLKNEIVIVSGSNMSGKTTFLRTVGINLVLLNAGAPVCAKSLKAAIFRIVTNMRVADDLSQGVSTFYAELSKVKLILESARQHKNTLFLIDEIFRGTNSADRLAGAKAVIKNLKKENTHGLITTHDLELCTLSEHSGIRNCNFSEYYDNAEIHFDYLLRAGPSHTTNAKFLMEMVGIINI